MKSDFKLLLRAIALLEKVLADNYATNNTHEIEPRLRDEIEHYLLDL